MAGAPREDKDRDLGFGARVAQQAKGRFLNRDGSFSRLEGEGALRARRFHELALDRRRVIFMPLHWVVVHPIDEASPLRGMTREEFERGDSEVMILLTAMDETFFQTVHVRSSYKADEVAWGHRFADMFLRTEDGLLGIDLRKLHDIEPAP